MKRRHLKSIPLFFLIICMIFPLSSRADVPDPATAALEMQNFFGLEAGYNFLDIDGGGETLMPYGYLDSSPLAGLDLVLYFPWKGTLDLTADYSGDSYYQFKGAFNYRGDVDFRVSSTEYPRNYEHMALPAADDPSFHLEDVNPDDAYSVDLNESIASLKLRAPNYPAHVSLGVRKFVTTGDSQLVFLNENCVTECHLVSQTRTTDKETTQLEAGADTHAGLVDASYRFKSTSFRDNEPNPTWRYGILFNRRNPGVLEHNTYPDIDAYEHAVTLSTSNTGRIAATVGYSIGQRENIDADLEQDYSASTGNIVWRPSSSLCMTARYNLLRVDNETSGATSQALRTSANVPLEMSTTKQIYSGSVCYAPLKMLRMKADIRYKKLTRDEAEGWDLPEETTTNRARLSTRLKPFKNLTFDLSYSDEQVDNPAHATALIDKDTLSAGLSWRPLPLVLFQTSFQSMTGTNDEDTNRDETSQKLFGGVTVSFNAPLSTGLYYTLFQNEVTNDLTIASGDPIFFASPGTSYEATGSQVLFQVNAKPFENFEITCGASYLQADGLLRDVKTPNFTKIGDYSELDATQSEFFIDFNYMIGKGWGIITHFGYLDYQDKISSDNDETIGEASALISKRW